MKHGTPQYLLSATGQKRQHNVFRYWVWELLALVLALAVTIAIIIILVKYDGQELPNWPYSININTLISLLSTLLRASLVIVMAQLISQAKWTWFSDVPHRISEFQSFDDASRGVIGSMNLIALLRFGYHGSPIAVIAAFATILSLAIGPFTQQAIKTVTCSHITTALPASLPAAMTLPGKDGFNLLGPESVSYDPGIGLKGAFINSIVNPSSNASSIQPTCSTGNCTFPEAQGITHSTIGICTKCLNTTSLAKFPKFALTGSSNITVGGQMIRLEVNAPWLSAGMSNLSFAEPMFTPEFAAASSQAFANITILSATQAGCVGYPQVCPAQKGLKSQFDDWNFVAATCSIYPCMKDISASVENGVLKEEVVSTTPTQSVADPSGHFTRFFPNNIAVKSPCLVDGKIYDTGNFSLVPNVTETRAFMDIELGGKNVSVPSDCYYVSFGFYSAGIGSFLENDLFNFQCAFNDGLGSNPNSNMVDCVSSWWLQTFYNSGNATFGTIEATMDGMATAVTNFLRADGYGPLNTTDYITANAAGRLNKNTIRIPGQAVETTVCMRLQWPWLILPASLCALTMALLAAMLATHYADHGRHFVWKSSLLPLLLGIDAQTEQPSDGPRGANDLLTLEKIAAEIKVRFDTEGARAGSSDGIPMMPRSDTKYSSSVETTDFI